MAAAKSNSGAIARATAKQEVRAANDNSGKAGRSIMQDLNGLLDKENLRKRFDDLLGKRAPQFMSSLVGMMNASPQLEQAFYEAPLTVISSALKAAAMDLPIDANLGYAYIVPFRNNKATKQDGSTYSRMEANFIIGWKGMYQLALRSGVYKLINVVDVREGELRSVDRLTGEYEFAWEEDDQKRQQLKIVGYAGYYRLVNGAEKTIYMSMREIEAHRNRFSKAKNGFGWANYYESMCQKTVFRRLIGKYGIMSIEYRASNDAVSLAQQMLDEDAMDQRNGLPGMLNDSPWDEDAANAIDTDYQLVDDSSVDRATGELLTEKGHEE